MTPAIATRLCHWGAMVAAAALASACSSVNLGSYNPPPIQMPGQSLQANTAAMPQDGVETHPVTSPVIGSDLPASPQDLQQPVDSGAIAQQPGPNGGPVTLTTRMDSRSVVPSVASQGIGQMDAIFDRNSRLLRWKASWSDLSSAIIGVQFRGPADAAQNAPIVMIWPAPFGSRYEGHATLNPQQVDDLLHGLWYVTVLTANFPQGEIRGQLRVVY